MYTYELLPCVMIYFTYEKCNTFILIHFKRQTSKVINFCRKNILNNLLFLILI